MVAGVFAAGFFKFAQQFFLAFREMNGGFDHNMTKQVAMAVAANALDTLAAQAEGLA